MLIGRIGSVAGLNKKEVQWLKEKITSENFKKVKITEEKLKEIKEEIKQQMKKMKETFKFKDLKEDEEFKKMPKSSRIKLEKDFENHIKNLEKIKGFVLNSKLEDIKKAALNFKECGVRVVGVDTSKV